MINSNLLCISFKSYIYCLLAASVVLIYFLAFDLSSIDEIVQLEYRTEIESLLTQTSTHLREANLGSCEDLRCTKATLILSDAGLHAPDNTFLYVVRIPIDSRFGNVITGSSIPQSSFSTDQTAFFENNFSLKIGHRNILGDSIIAYIPVSYSQDQKYRYFLVAETGSKELVDRAAKLERKHSMYFLMNLVVLVVGISSIYMMLFTVEQILRHKERAQ